MKIFFIKLIKKLYLHELRMGPKSFESFLYIKGKEFFSE